MGYYKFRVCLPPESLEAMREAVKPIIARSDKYMGAMTWYPVKSAWITLPGANPYNGIPGKEAIADEYVLEFRVEKANKEKAMEIIPSAHPYEEPGIDVMELVD